MLSGLNGLHARNSSNNPYELSFLTKNFCHGRLTLDPNNPLCNTDHLEAKYLYYVPYSGNFISLSKDNIWQNFRFDEPIEISLDTFAPNTLYNVFVYFDENLQLKLSNNTLKYIIGTPVDSNNNYCRFIGQVYLNENQATEVSNRKCLLWNYYNRENKVLNIQESNDAWIYNKLEWNFVKDNENNYLQFIYGSTSDFIDLKSVLYSSGNVLSGVGINDKNNVANVANNLSYFTGFLNNPGLHNINWLEYGDIDDPVIRYGKYPKINNLFSNLTAIIRY